MQLATLSEPIFVLPSPQFYLLTHEKGKSMKNLISAVAMSFCLMSAANAKDIVDTAVSAGNFNTLATTLCALD